MTDLDDVDRAILHFLTADARHNSATDIADHVRVSAQTVRNRIDRLEEAGVIRGYHANVDFERAEGFLTNLFMCTTSARDRERLGQQALGIPGVVHVREIMTGRTDLRIVAVGSDTDEMTRIARRITDLGIEIEQEDLIRNEHFGPYRRHDAGTAEASALTDLLTLSGDATLAELRVEAGAPIAGLTVAEATDTGFLDEDVVLVSLDRAETVQTPHGETTLEADDRVTLLARTGVDESLKAAFTEND